MAINPMQRRSRNSMIIGVILGLVIGAIGIGAVFIQLNNVQNQLKKEKARMSTVPVAAKDIAANAEITENDITTQEVITSVLQSEIVGKDHISGNKKLTEPTSDVSKKTADALLQATYNGKNIKAASTLLNNLPGGTNNNSNNGSNGNNGNAENNQNSGNQNGNSNSSNTNNQSGTPVNSATSSNSGASSNANGQTATGTQSQTGSNSKFVAAVKIPKGTIITKDMIIAKEDSLDKEENQTQREVEYNMVTLPSELADEDTIDVRVSFPNGQDFVVLSKKIVKKSDANTIWLKVNEDEILKMNSAIVESYLIDGAKLYAVNYSKPGLQKEINTTYPVNAEVARLLGTDPNISQKIKNELNSAVNTTMAGERTQINQIIANQDGDANKVGTAVKNEIKERQDKRKKYIEKLTGEVESN